VTDRLYSRYRADTDVKWIKQNQTKTFANVLMRAVVV